MGAGQDRRSPIAGPASDDGTDARCAADREAARLRHRVRELLGAWHLRELADRVADLVGDLVTEAGSAARPRGRRPDVRLQVRQGVLRAEVRAVAGSPRQDLASLLGGRSDRWGCTVSERGSLLWFELGVRPQDRRRAQPPPVLLPNRPAV